MKETFDEACVRVGTTLSQNSNDPETVKFLRTQECKDLHNGLIFSAEEYYPMAGLKDDDNEKASDEETILNWQLRNANLALAYATAFILAHCSADKVKTLCASNRPE